MIETSTTPNLNPIACNRTEDQEMITFFDESITTFYESLKPALQSLRKAPSDKSVNNILEFSKSVSN